MSRIAGRFAELARAGRAAFVPFITAGDPDAETSFAILEKLPEAGADLIELGLPFSDPMADGPAIQASSTRALKAGMTAKGTLALVERFRKRDASTPVIVMGYFNPIHAYGVERFAEDAGRAGVDGLIVVDLGPEEDAVLRVLWAQLSPRQQNVLRALATSATGLTTKARRAAFTLGQTGAATKAAQTLVDQNILVKSETGYRYDSPFMRGWVIANALADAGVTLPITHQAG